MQLAERSKAQLQTLEAEDLGVPPADIRDMAASGMVLAEKTLDILSALAMHGGGGGEGEGEGVGGGGA